MPGARGLALVGGGTNPTGGRAQSSSLQNAIAPAPAPAPAPYSGGGGSYSGGGGGGGTVAAATQAVVRPNLTDYINGNFLYQNANNEANRSLSDFDADTNRQQAIVAADQAQKEQSLKQQLADAGIQSAEDLAGRGLLRSGLTLQAQDKINQQGQQQENSIQDLLTNFLSGRQTARLSQEAQNRQNIAAAVSQLTNQYANQYGA